MAKRTNKSSVVVPVVEVSEVSETVLSDVLGPVSEELPSEVSETVSEVLDEVLSDVFTEEVVVELSALPEEKVETVPVEVPNDLLRNFNRWLSGTLERKKNGGTTSNGKRLGRPVTKLDKVVRLIKEKGQPHFRQNSKGRPPLFAVTYQISVPKDLVITAETRFNVDLNTGDWSVVVPVTEEIQETLAA